MAEASATLDLADRTREADSPHSPVVRFAPNNPLRLDAGVDFGPLQIAYQTYGTLNAERTNAVLVCHALTGDQHVLNTHPVTGKTGWWETLGGRSTPSVISSSARTWSAVAWARPARPRPIRQPACRGAWNSPSSPCAT